MTSDIENFRLRLNKKLGYSEAAISAAWPEWWSKEAEGSPSAEAELRFSMARKLGLDPRSLLDDEGPRFFWDDSAKFKHFKGDDQRERPAISAFGISISRMLIKTVEPFHSIVGVSASELRTSILKLQPFVSFIDLLKLLWGVGIPIIYLRVHPLEAKRMAAMAVAIQKRHAILLAKDAQYPAPVAFHVAHEIGHIALGHVVEGSAVVDMESPVEYAAEADKEEKASDRFALELLTGDPNFTIEKLGKGRNPGELALQVQKVGLDTAIEPGTLAMCYGYVTGEWDTVFAALPFIYEQAIPVWMVTNRIAKQQMEWDALGDENGSFIRAVIGGI